MLKKLMHFLPVFLFGVLLAGCSSDAHGPGNNDLSGVWYGEGFYKTDDGKPPNNREEVIPSPTS